MNTKANMKGKVFLILHNIRSAENVGSIFRTADAVGVSKIYLSGFTPCPIDKFGRKKNKIAKTALGAEKSVEWEYQENISKFITQLKKEKIQIIAVEQDGRSVNYKKFKSQKPIALILGNEVTGLSKSILDKSDKIVEIPMKGKKESLNVSVVAGIILFSSLTTND